MSRNLLKDCFIKTEKIKPITLGGTKEITVRQLSAGEGLEYRSILRDKDKTQEDAIYFAVKCAMVEPTFFTDEELKNLNGVGRNLIYEIHEYLPKVGMTKKEKEDFDKKIKSLVKELENTSEPSEEETEKK